MPSSPMIVLDSGTPVSIASAAFAVRWRYSPWTGSTLRGRRML